MELSGAIALVTGGSSGIGRATAIALSRKGSKVMLTGRDRATLASAAAASGGEWLAADLAEDDDMDRLAEWAGEVDLLVNNAGLGWSGPFAAMPDRSADELVRVNLLAPMRLSSLVLPGMIARRRGHIVNIGSIAGHVGVPLETVYSATKWGLAGFTESLRGELSGTGVAVSLVSPGVVRTRFFERAGHPYDRAFPRPISPERVARAVVHAVRTGAHDVFIPRWMAFPARLHGTWPWFYRRLSSRYG